MKSALLSVLCSVSFMAMAQERTQPLPKPLPVPKPAAPAVTDPFPAPGAVGEQPVPEKQAFKLVNGAWDVPDMFYLAERDLKWRRDAGHGVSLAILATCPGLNGKPAEKLQALYEMDQALMKNGPIVYRGGDVPVLNNRSEWVTVRMPATDIKSNAIASQIAAVLTCRQGNQKAEDVAAMLAVAVDRALSMEAKHRDTKEPLRWAPNLKTVLLVATVVLWN